MRLFPLAATLAGLIALTATPALADRSTPQYTSLTVFGDSLVDAGNYSIATGGATPAASSGYFDGRFTNGYDYTDMLSQALFGHPTTPSLAGGSNYAVGGANAINTGFAGDFAPQLAFYKSNLGAGSADPNGLFVLNFGGNDIFGDLSNSLDGYPTVDAFLQASAAQYAAGVQELNDLGARNILITGYPVTSTPDSYTADGYLTADLAALNLNPDTTIMQYSYTSFFERDVNDPASLGLPPVYNGTACTSTNTAPACPGLFNFDGTHPTEIVQQALFRDINAEFNLTGVQGVPEPAIWCELLLGFGALGGAMRRRGALRRRQVFAA
jgi:phospholipase/lecithinase/hemolysin